MESAAEGSNGSGSVNHVNSIASGVQDAKATKDHLDEGEAGFLAVFNNGTVAAGTRKELKAKIASLISTEKLDPATPIEVYRVKRLPIAQHVAYKF